MKFYLTLLAAALALTACGDDDKPKKKKVQAESVAETPAPVAAPETQPQPQPVAQTQPEETPAEPTPTPLPTDEQSGYKAYIEQPAPVVESAPVIQQPIEQPIEQQVTLPPDSTTTAPSIQNNVSNSEVQIIYPPISDLPAVLSTGPAKSN